MHQSEIAGLMKALAPIVGDFVTKAVAPLRAQNQALHGRLNAIEQRVASVPSKEDSSVVILRLVEETVAKLPPAQPGKDADPVEVANLLVDLMPVPAPGKDADPETISRMVREEVAKLPPPEPGKDADPALVSELVDKAVAALPPAKDGDPGPAGDSVTVEQLVPLVADTVAKAVSDEMEKVAANLPAGKDGAPGEPGDSVTVDDLRPIVKELVLRTVAEMPSAKDGAEGKEGPPGRDGRDGLPGVQGEKGADGRHGVDGKDGLGIDDFDVITADEGRTLEFALRREGQEPIVKKVLTGTVLHRGVWSEQAYAKGDSVTWSGSSFIATRDTADKPETSDAWRLSVKRGRDGKEGKPGPTGERGQKGDPGTPGRNLV